MERDRTVGTEITIERPLTMRQNRLQAHRNHGLPRRNSRQQLKPGI
jgi:hypothetical protein